MLDDSIAGINGLDRTWWHPTRVVTGLIGGIVLVIAALSVAARRRSIPCPHWLSCLVENPFVDRVEGAELLLDRLDLRPGMRVLDVGCGPGRVSLPAARRVGPAGEVLGLDIQDEMLRRARSRAQAQAIGKLRFVRAAAGQGALAPGQFDRALLVTVLGEIPDRGAALAEIQRSLKPGGLLSVTEVLPDPHYQSVATVRRLAVAAGFAEDRWFGGARAFTANFVKPELPPDVTLPANALDPVAETLVIPLYYRAAESARPDAILRDPRAADVVRRLDYDFSRVAGLPESQRVMTLMRARELDRQARAFRKRHPDGFVVDIGCGLDTRFDRLDEGRLRWIGVDLPEVIALRRRLVPDTDRARTIGRSALDPRWLDDLGLPDGHPVLFLAEGLLPYFEEADARRLVSMLCDRFPAGELAFDAVPDWQARVGRLHPAIRVTRTRIRWGMRSSRALEAWHPGLRLAEEWFYYDRPEPRLGCWRLLRWVPPIGKGFRVVRYRLGGGSSGAAPGPGKTG